MFILKHRMNLKTVQQLRITSNCIKSLWNRSFCIELIGEQRDASHQDGRLQKGESDCIATSGSGLSSSKRTLNGLQPSSILKDQKHLYGDWKTLEEEHES